MALKIMKTIIILSGGFDPVHKGHIRMFKAAKEFPSIVIVGANSDEWLSRKKVKLTVTASGEYNLTNEITGFETDTTGADKYKAGLNFRVDY